MGFPLEPVRGVVRRRGCTRESVAGSGMVVAAVVVDIREEDAEDAGSDMVDFEADWWTAMAVRYWMVAEVVVVAVLSDCRYHHLENQYIPIH